MLQNKIYYTDMDRERAKRFVVLWLSKRAQKRNTKELEWKTLIWQQLERRRRLSVAVIILSKRLEKRYWMNKLQQEWFDDMWRLRVFIFSIILGCSIRPILSS